MTNDAHSALDAGAASAGLSHDELVYLSARTRVVRVRLPDGAGSVVFKALSGPDALERRRHEIRILERLAGIEGVPRLATGSHLQAIALEDGGDATLAQLTRGLPLALPALLTLALQLARILAAVHHAGVIHKDINPANIMFAGPSRQPLLIDFDLASTFTAEQPGFTHHSEIVGTLAYLAPEQTGRTGRTVDQRADLYALGATLYEMAVGHPPFVEDDPLQLIRLHLAQVPTAPRALQASLPQSLSDIILRLLEKEPERRYQSADGLAHDLARLGEAQARGDSTPFPLGERDFALRLAPPSRLIGRDGEIASLQAAFDHTLNGQRRGVLVAGAPGVGKTALINKLRPMVTARCGWFVSGKFDQYRQDMDADAVRQALRALGRLLLAEPETAMLRQRARIVQALGSNAGLITAMVPEFALLLGPQPATDMSNPGELEGRLMRAGLALLRAIVSPERPIVMVLDDLQWAAATPIHFIDELLCDESLRGLLVVGAYRAAEVDATHPLAAMLPRWERLGALSLRLHLQNLPPSDLGALLADMLRLPAAPAAQLADAVNANTNGNPFDTVELVNALRRDGALVPCNDGWHWDATTIRRYIGRGDVVDLLTVRIAQLPQASQTLLAIMACLGGELALGLLAGATGLSVATLEQQLAAPLEDGLLVLQQEQDSTVRFRHDRVQQAAYGSVGLAERHCLHLDLARRLATLPGLRAKAAEQYLAAAETLRDPDECRQAIVLFREAASHVHLVNYGAAERFLAAALALLANVAANGEADAALLAILEIERHAALYSMGRLDEADALYRSIEAGCRDPLGLVDAACVQIDSLMNRGKVQESITLGLALLQQLGLPPPNGDAAADIAPRLAVLYRWLEKNAQVAPLASADTTDPRILALTRLIGKIMQPAFHADLALLAWLVLETQRLWAQHGFCAAMVGPLSHTGVISIALRQDYRNGYNAVQQVLKVSQTRGYEQESARARLLSALFAGHWFEPLENNFEQMQLARDSLLQGGDLQNACYTYVPSLHASLECAPTLGALVTETDAAFAFAARTGNLTAAAVFFPFRALLKELGGPTSAPGNGPDTVIDDADYLAGPTSTPAIAGNFHIMRALAGAVLADPDRLSAHGAVAVAMAPTMHGAYAGALAYLLQALALAQQVQAAEPDERPRLLAELDNCRDWLARRAGDAPGNFLHVLRLVEAERAWAVDDFRLALCAFDVALREMELHQRPWSQALIAERAGLFHLAHGLERSGRTLLVEARQRYQAWGATAKVQQLERTHSFLREARGFRLEQDQHASNGVSIDTIDMLAILRTSQALSSETSLDRLKARVIDLLGTMTGATQVLIVLPRDAPAGWILSTPGADEPLSVEQAGASGALPLSVFRYVERTKQPLLVEDATGDDRFASDPYLAGLERCSLLVVPILSQGVPRAVLMLENRLSRGAFSADRLDAVMLIAGQLAVSLDNAMLYASLERKVAERTGALHAKGLEQQVLIQRLQDTQAQLLQSEKMASIGQLAAGVAHEINNPIGFVNSNMNSLNGLVDELLGVIDAYDRTLEDLPLASNLRTAIATLRKTHDLDFLKEDVNALIKESIDGLTRVKDIVQAMKDFSHVGESDWQLADVHHGIDSTLHIASNEFKYKARIDKQYGQLPPVRCLASQLNQVFMNLIVNAAYAIEAEGVITIRTGCDGDWIWIEIGDNGSGIPADKLTRIFEPFFTTKPVGKGTGLGLSLSYNIVHKHGGRIDVASEPGKGSRFTLHLPVNPVAGVPECVE